MDIQDGKIIGELVGELKTHVKKLINDKNYKRRQFANRTNKEINHLIERLPTFKSTKSLFNTTSKVLYKIFRDMEGSDCPPQIAVHFIKSKEDLEFYNFIHCLRVCGNKIHNLLSPHAEKVEKQKEAIEERNEWMQDVWGRLHKMMI